MDAATGQITRIAFSAPNAQLAPQFMASAPQSARHQWKRHGGVDEKRIAE